jgi:hypothetical protein
MTMGYIVRVGGPLASDVWHVALADPDRALQAARDAAGPDAQYKEVRILGGLGPGELDQLGLLPGQIHKISSRRP